MTSRLEAIAIGLAAIARRRRKSLLRWRQSLLGWRPSHVGEGHHF